MGRVQLFEIRLSQGRVVYGPGEPLAGTVHLRLGAPLPFRGSLPAGEHNFPFQFLLPATAPTSFEGPFGKIVHQKVSYKAKRWIYDVRTIAEVEGTGVKAWRRAQWQEQILVPALPQSALPGCSLIHIDYYLQVSMKAPEATVTLPPEYSSWGYPYEAPPSYEQSCGAAGTDLGLIPGS